MRVVSLDGIMHKNVTRTSVKVAVLLIHYGDG